jgi:nucleotide-binding universal stress UspA family protein
MKTVLAAVDNSLAGRPVIATAEAFAAILGAGVEAVHVQTDGDLTARSAADAAGVPLHLAAGAVVEALVAAGDSPDVIALVVGARGTPGGRRPLGGTAAAVATRVLKPVVIVPPDASVPTTFRRVLVPIEDTVSASLVPRTIFDLAGESKVDVVALHVLDEDSIPAFTDQPQHEHLAWAHEFLERHCPTGLGRVRLETRVGRADQFVAAVAVECACDLIALGWSQELAPGRAPIVRATLARSRVPVLLVPVRVVGASAAAGPPAARARPLSPATS